MKTTSPKAHPTYLKLIRKWLSLGLLSTLGSPAFAATLTWTTGDGGNGLWSNTSNWGGATPAVNDTLVFGTTTGTTTLTHDLPNTYLWSNGANPTNQTNFRTLGITFNADAPAYTINGTGTGSTTFTVDGTIQVNSASNITQTINSNLSATNGVTVAGSGNLTLNGSYVRLGTYNAHFVMNGTGLLTLGGSGGFAPSGGSFTVNSGTVLLGKTIAGAFAPAAVVLNGGTLKLGAANQFGVGAVASLVINAGTFDLNGFNTQAALPTGNAPALNGLGGLITNGNASTTSTLVTGGALTTGSYGGTISDGAGQVALYVNDAGAGANLTILSGKNNYTGGTNIRAITGDYRPAVLSVANVASIGSVGFRNLTFSGSDTTAQTVLQLTGTSVTNSNQLDSLTFTSGNGVGIDVADPTNTFTLGKNASGGNITMGGTGILMKKGAGTLEIASSLTYSGSTLITGGTVKINAQAGGALASTSTLNMAGGSLYLLGKTTGTTTQTLGNVSMGIANNNFSGIGGSKITVDANGGGGTTLALGTLDNSTANGGTLNIKVGTGGTVTTTTTSVTSGLLGNGRIVFTDASDVVDFAAINASGTPRTVQAATYSGGSLPASGSDLNTNYSHTGNATVTASESVNALKLTTSTTGESLAIDPGQTLTLTTGGLLFTSANDYSITGGTLKSNTATNSDLIVHQYGAGNLTISSVIADGVGKSVLTKAGDGTLTLSGTNTYTGLTLVTGGTLSISSDSNLGGTHGTFGNLTSTSGVTAVTSTAASLPTGFVVGSTMLGKTVTAITGTSGAYTITLATGGANTTLSNGTASWAYTSVAASQYDNSGLWLSSGGVLQATSSFSLSESNAGGGAGTTTANRRVTIGNGGGGFDVTGANTLTVPGTINATGMMTKSGTGTLVLSGSNTLTGGLTIHDGTVQLANANAVTNSSTGGTATTNLIFGSGSSAKLKLNNNDAKVTSLVSSNTAAIVENGSGTAGTKTLTVVNGADNTYAGILRNGSTGLLALAKSGGGTLTVNNASNTFTGGLTIYNGILEGTQTGTLGSGTITLADGTLKATGAFTNAIVSAVNFTNNSALTTSYLNNTINTSVGNASFSGVLSGAGALNKTGANILTLSHATNTYNGTLTATTGTVSFASMGSAATLVMAGGNFTSTGNTTVASLAVNTAGTLAVSSNYLTVGALTGSNALTVTGGNAYTSGLKLIGTTNSGFSGTINTAASLHLANENLLGTNANALTMSAGRLVDNGSPLTISSHSVALTGYITIQAENAAGDMTITGGITGTGGVTFRSQSSRAIVLGGTNSYNGNTEIYTDDGNSSTLRMSAANTLPSGTGKGNLQLTAWNTGNAVLDLNGNSQTVNGLISAGTNAATRTIIDNVTAGGNVTLTVGAGNATGNTFAGIVKNTTGTLSLTKTGSGTQTLTGANTYTGGTTINAGTLALSGSGSLSDLTAVVVNSPGSFDISGISSSEKIASLSGATGSTLKLGAKVLEFGDANDTSFAGAVESNTGGGVKKVGAGVFTLGASSYAGTGLSINISQGSLLTSANNLPSSTAFTLSGGALNTGTFSNTVGSLSVTSGSIIDFAGGGTPVLTFASRGTWSGLLQVWNWSGSAWSSGTGGQLRFADGVDGSLVDVSKIQFYSGAGTGLISEGGAFIGTQLVPVPEPTTLASSMVLLGFLGFQRRRKSGSEHDAA